MSKRQRTRREDYTVGWVCALPIELAAAHEMLDEEHEDLYYDANDTNIYTLGRIGEHNVVLACLPEMGNNSAAAVAVRMKMAFTSIRFGLMVGIGGGVPSPAADIRLGDVVVSKPNTDHGGVVQYDFGKNTPGGFKRTGFLHPPPATLLTAVTKLRANHMRGRFNFQQYVPKSAEFARCGENDVVFESNYNHEGGSTCEQCQPNRTINRPPRLPDIMVHYGTVASGNQVMKNAVERDKVSAELGGVLCFEMEAAGLMNSFPCLIIRGIADYADSHKNKRWQPFAAGTAAAYAKELLSVIPPADVANSMPVNEIMYEKDVLDGILNRLPIAVEAPFNPYNKQHEPVCLQNTRTNLLEEISRWTNGPTERHIYWLSGWAGTGKSTIARTVARNLSDQAALAASFFFSRGGGDVSHAGKFVTSIAVQLARNIPGLRRYICDAITERSDIINQSLHDQWKRLILDPLAKYKDSSSPSYVLVIDALDECDDDNNIRVILQLLTQLRTLTHIRMRVFLTSRPELPIRYSFVKLSAEEHEDLILHKISQNLVDQDIAVFFEHKLRIIAQENSLNANWPGEQTIKRLVDHANGLFIWAATACRFIRDGKMFAPRRLSMILNGSRGSVTAPEKHLNGIYTALLRNSISAEYAEDETQEFCKTLKNILGSIAVLHFPLSMSALGKLLRYPPERISQTLEDLHAILEISQDDSSALRLHHPSFRDFLVDKTRCLDGRFWVHERKAHYTLAVRCVQLMQQSLRKDLCNLGAPGVLIADVESDHVEQCMNMELQYACLYWVQHLQRADYRLKDNDKFHQFLKDHLLQWLEGLSLMRRMPEGVVAIRILETLSHKSDCFELQAFIHDIKRFILYSRPAIEQAPLQVYCSALVFAPAMSIVRNQFQDWMPEWIQRFPKVEKDWNALLATLEDHRAWVKAVAFSPDGTLIASASWDKTIRMWDARSGASLHVLEGHDEPVKAVAFSLDEKLLASASDDETVLLWDARLGTEVACLQGHTGPVNALAFSPDSSLLVSGSDDRNVRLWSIESRLPLSTLKGHTSSVRAVAFSPDGKTFASASWDRTVRLWDTYSGQLRYILEDHVSSINDVAFSPDSRCLASASHDRTVILWDANSGKAIKTLKGHISSVRAVAFSSNGRQLASASWDRTVRLWDIRTGGEIATFEGHTGSINAVVFSPDGKQLVSASDDTTLMIWDSQLKSVPIREDHRAWVRAMAFSADGRILASASDDQTVRLWDSQTGESLSVLEGHGSRVNAVMFSPDAKLLASASNDGIVKIWETESASAIQTFEIDAVVSNLSFSHDGKYLITERGPLRLSLPSSASPPPAPQLWPAIFVKKQWVTREMEKRLWLPPEYRAGSAAVHGNVVALGSTSGRVSILEFTI